MRDLPDKEKIYTSIKEICREMISELDANRKYTNIGNLTKGYNNKVIRNFLKEYGGCADENEYESIHIGTTKLIESVKSRHDIIVTRKEVKWLKKTKRNHFSRYNPEVHRHVMKITTNSDVIVETMIYLSKTSPGLKTQNSKSLVENNTHDVEESGKYNSQNYAFELILNRYYNQLSAIVNDPLSFGVDKKNIHLLLGAMIKGEIDKIETLVQEIIDVTEED